MSSFVGIEPNTRLDLALLAKRWWVIALTTLILGTVAGAFALVSADTYRSEVVLAYAPSAAASPTGASSSTEVTAAFLAGAANLSGDQVLGPVAQQVGLELGEVRDQVAFEPDPDTLTLTLTAEADGAAGAREMAIATADAAVDSQRQSAKRELSIRADALESAASVLQSEVVEDGLDKSTRNSLSAEIASLRAEEAQLRVSAEDFDGPFVVTRAPLDEADQVTLGVVPAVALGLAAGIVGGSFMAVVIPRRRPARGGSAAHAPHNA